MAPLLAALLIVFVSGCGGDDDADTGSQASIVSDNGPLGAAALVKGDSASGSQDQRIPITAKGSPTVVYQLPVRSLEEGMHLRAIANLTLTKCAITDYMPNARADTACQGTREYGYDPVEIESRFRIVGGGSAPDLSGPGQNLGPAQRTSCTTKIHHCSIAADYEIDFSAKDAGANPDSGGASWIVFEVSASSSKATGCAPPTAKGCNVLAVETQKGQAMYWVQAEAGISEPSKLPRDGSANVRRLDVLTDRGDKNDVRKVVYSAELGPGDSIGDLEGQQMEIDSLLRIREELPQAPDIAGYLVLADSPTSIRGRYLISDGYDSNKTGNDGGNCDSSCRQSRPAAVTALQSCDVEAGRRYVNLVADASRATAKKGESVQVADGGYVQVSRLFSAAESTDVPSSERGCSP